MMQEFFCCGGNFLANASAIVKRPLPRAAAIVAPQPIMPYHRSLSRWRDERSAGSYARGGVISDKTA
jgi:hypothetical protein